MTNREFFEKVLTLTDEPEMLEKAQAQIDILDRKSTSRKPTANQVENSTVIQPKILEVLADGKALTVTEIANEIGCGYTNQRISANVQKLAKAGTLIRVCDKKVARYSLA